MLADEGVVKPDGIRPDEWDVWRSGATVLGTAGTLLAEASSAIETIHGGNRTGRGSRPERARGVPERRSGADASLFLGFSANQSAARPVDFPVILGGRTLSTGS